MGIRIHKCIGYGVLDFKGDKDSRFKPHMFDYDYMEDKNISLKELDKWASDNWEECLGVCKTDLASGFRYDINDPKDKETLKKHMLGDLGIYPNINNISVSDGIVIPNDDYGKKNVLYLRPPSHENWERYDDIIDHCENGEGTLGNKDKAKVLKNSWCGIWPYSIGMVRFRGKAIEGSRGGRDYNQGSMGPSEYSQLTGRWSRKAPPIASGELLEDFQNNWRMHIPTELIIMLQYLDICVDLKTFLGELKPIIYEYWR